MQNFQLVGIDRFGTNFINTIFNSCRNKTAFAFYSQDQTSDQLASLNNYSTPGQFGLNQAPQDYSSESQPPPPFTFGYSVPFVIVLSL